MTNQAVITLTVDQVVSVLQQQSGSPVPPSPPIQPPATPSVPENAIVVVMSWVSPVPLLTSAYGGMGFNNTLVIQFTTGSVSTTNNLPSIVAVEYVDPPSQRMGTLSREPNNFGFQSFGGTSAPFATAVGNTITLPFAIGDTEGVVLGGYPRLKKNTTYYTNIKNNVPDMGGYNMRVVLQKPGGL